eukprot:CAMPEP_0194759386 /NCGR_PEP_ID=MMETSP0323_2-20130528/12448_1 /TAXON_ID=2866 ORGANISM="Crypthecodinium cohnii, Strain Seligo" /NCGR_SAMPLE_ID=MMETSP0323_2 /ASSEMBLY_ACC=CAM_ASM_000346 /LENGTH=50 /DNA_ID=CAMNT_0039680081 /DNA_START=225 /DNA_END=377 /DNA_ORIENTATION=+
MADPTTAWGCNLQQVDDDSTSTRKRLGMMTSSSSCRKAICSSPNSGVGPD